MENVGRALVTEGTTYGPLQAQFEYDVRRGYTALVGPNNSGKSTILQLVFRALHADPEFGRDNICLILPDRDRAQKTSQPGDRNLASWNQELSQVIGGGPLQYGPSDVGPDRAELARLLLHRNLMAQMRSMEALLPRMGLPNILIGGGQEWGFDALSIAVQGSGLRAAFPILAAQTDVDIKAILVDEPELSLEPRLQKALRDTLVMATDHVPVIIVATHSHLFLNRQELESTQVVERSKGVVTVRTVTTQAELEDITFGLLGNSTEDLFFPRNYIVVEGSSDQEIVTKVLELLDARVPTIKVLAAGGIDTIERTVESVRRALVPLYVRDSPYARRVVALIDQPRAGETQTVQKLRDDLGDRLFELDTPTIEEYIPEAIFARAGRSKDADLAHIEELRDNYKGRSSLKREISHALADNLTIDDLDDIPLVQAVVRAAIDASHDPP